MTTSDIPPNVYWNADACNFYGFPQAQGMGDAFFREWHQRVAEFPKGPHAPNWCTHYRSAVQHDTCQAGVVFDKWHTTPFPQRPCYLTDQAASKPDAVTCPHLRRPTAAETDMWKRATHGGLQRLFAALAASAEWREANAGQNATTSLPCPTCGKRLHVVIAGSAGHISGQCETPDCTKWIE